jgi:hypothetical protein
LKYYNSKPRGHTGFNLLYGEYRRRAKKKKWKFEITLDEFKEITSKNCFYCGEIPRARRSMGREKRICWPPANGIDRVDSDSGYIKSNILPCCYVCNRMKNAMTISKFLNKIIAIVKHNPYLVGS